MSNSTLWPIRYKPLPDELLSSWLVRLAHGHGLKVQTLCNLTFGAQRQIWNRDIDRLAQPWLRNELSVRTGASAASIFHTTLQSYEGILYRRFRTAGALPWILVQQMYHRKRNGHGLQFCPTCLAEDSVPYFRKHWRIALVTVCVKHHTMLLDRCPGCGTAIAIHRVDMTKADMGVPPDLCFCHSCELDLRFAQATLPDAYDAQSTATMYGLSKALSSVGSPNNAISLDNLSVLHQLTRTMTSRYKHVQLRRFVLERLGVRDIYLSEGYMSLEMRPIEQRHHLLQLSSWLFADLEARLSEAWHAGMIRYNVLLKDFPNAPDGYRNIIKNFANWRSRSLNLRIQVN